MRDDELMDQAIEEVIAAAALFLSSLAIGATAFFFSIGSFT